MARSVHGAEKVSYHAIRRQNCLKFDGIDPLMSAMKVSLTGDWSANGPYRFINNLPALCEDGAFAAWILSAKLATRAGVNQLAIANHGTNFPIE